MKKIYAIVSLLLAFIPMANATAAPIKGGFCISNSFDGAESVFACQYLGKVTIQQIYEKGWRVVTFHTHPDFHRTVEVVIEEQR